VEKAFFDNVSTRAHRASGDRTASCWDTIEALSYSIFATSFTGKLKRGSTRPSKLETTIFLESRHFHASFSTRMIEIQSQLTQRCIELLALPEDQPAFLLDVGFGQ
jgi:hypothetical protein